MTKRNEDWRYKKGYAEKALTDNYRSAVAQLKAANARIDELEAEKKILQNINAELEARVEELEPEWSNAKEAAYQKSLEQSD